MRILKTISAVLAVSVVAVGPALAQSADTTPSIMLHVNEVVTGKGVCDAPPSDCASLVTAGDANSLGAFYNVYLIAAGPPNEGVSGVELSIWYETSAQETQGIKMFQWNLCATQEFAAQEWPNAFTNNTITWDIDGTPCEQDTTGQGGMTRVGGYFYLGAYSGSLMQILPRQDNDRFTVSNCAGSEVAIDPARGGWVSFGGREGTAGDTDGCNSCLEDCGPVPVEATTWGGIKQTLGG